jgi:phage terminase small subunit
MADIKPKKLTVKQTKFVKAYVASDGNGQEAAKAVYDVKTDGVARSIASENLTKPNIKDAIEKALIKHNITIDAALAPIADGLTATKEQYTEHGVVETKDHSTRLKASGMALKLMGAEKTDEGKGNIINFINGNASFNSGNYKD